MAALAGAVCGLGVLGACGTTKATSRPSVAAAGRQAVSSPSGSPGTTTVAPPAPATPGKAPTPAPTAHKANSASSGGGGGSGSGTAVATASTAVPRLRPSSAEVMQAVRVLQSHIPFFHITESQARDFGNQVCTALDQGQTYAQVKAAVQQKLNRVPLIHVSSSNVDYAIRTAVSLFCPGHSSKLS